MPALPNRVGWLLAYFESLGCLYPVLFSLLHCLPVSEQVEALTSRLKMLLFALGETNIIPATGDLHSRFSSLLGDMGTHLCREPDWFELKVWLLNAQPLCNAISHELLIFSWELGDELFSWEIGHCPVMRASEQTRLIADAYDKQGKMMPTIRIGQLWHLLECILAQHKSLW